MPRSRGRREMLKSNHMKAGVRGVKQMDETKRLLKLLSKEATQETPVR